MDWRVRTHNVSCCSWPRRHLKTSLVASRLVASRAWRPPIAEVYMHIAVANYFLLGQIGIKAPVDLTTLGKQPDKGKTAKADVIAFLKASMGFVRETYPEADRQKKVVLFKKNGTADDLLLRIVVHHHEHMGQSIAYARMNGVVPPWSGGQ